MTAKRDTWTRRAGGKPETYVEVETDRRSYSVIGSGRVAWEKNERVVRIEAKTKGPANERIAGET